MEIDKERLEQIIRESFTAGESWGITYSSWFIPTEEDTEKRIKDFMTKVVELTDETK